MKFIQVFVFLCFVHCSLLPSGSHSHSKPLCITPYVNDAAASGQVLDEPIEDCVLYDGVNVFRTMNNSCDHLKHTHPKSDFRKTPYTDHNRQTIFICVKQ